MENEDHFVLCNTQCMYMLFLRLIEFYLKPKAIGNVMQVGLGFWFTFSQLLLSC